MNQDSQDRTFTLADLATLTGLSLRTVRYYIQMGLLDRPLGEKRGAYYLKRHLDQLLQIRRWVDAGLSLERIAELVAGAPEDPPPRPNKAGSVEIWSRLHLADGVELHLSPDRAGLNPEQARALVQAVTNAYRDIRAHTEGESLTIKKGRCSTDSTLLRSRGQHQCCRVCRRMADSTACILN